MTQLLFLLVFQLLPPSTAPTPNPVPADTVPVVRVMPHLAIGSVGFKPIGTDSTLRWERWWSPSERRSRQAGVVSARLTGFLRHDASYIRGYVPGRQRVFIDGVELADPMTGLVNPHRIPHQNVDVWEESGAGTVHRTRLSERDFYLTRPLTTIDYEQGSFNRRSTDATFAANLSTQTGYSLRFWGKNDDGEYLGSPTSGRLMSARIYHHPDSVWKWVGQIRYQGLQTTEPNGFDTFNYIPQATTPRENADASVRDLLVNGFLAHRNGARYGAHAGSYRRFYHGEADSAYYKVRSAGVYGQHRTERAGVELEAVLRSTAYATEGFRLVRAPSLPGVVVPEPTFRYQSGGGRWMRTEAEVDVRAGRFGAGGILTHNSAAGEVVAGGYASADLGAAHAALAAGSDGYFRYDVGVRFRRLSVDAHLVSDHPHPNLSAEYRFETPRWDLGASVTAQNLGNDEDGARFWNRAWIYWSGYLFDRATYVKTGFHGTLVPMGYHAPIYSPLFDQWAYGARDFGGLTDPFYRIDYDVTARVRNLFVYLRYEHLNQNAGQFGYQEVEGYPMPGRHLRFGMKVVLRN